MTQQRAHLEQELAALFAAKTPFLIVDTETTGFLNDPNGQIIEIACVNQDGQVIFTSLVKPDCAVPAKATAVHGLSDADLAGAPTFTEIWPELLTILVQYSLVYAYNVVFDQGMLLKTARHYGLDIPDWLTAQEWRCMMEAYAVYHGDWSDWHQSYTYKKLSMACAALHVPLSKIHRATGDALNTLGLMKALAVRGVAATTTA